MTAHEIIERLRRSAPCGAPPTKEEYMIQVAERFNKIYGETLDTSSDESFVQGLRDKEIIK